MDQGQIILRHACADDLPAIADIYNFESLNTLNNLRHAAQPLPFFQDYLASHTTPDHPFLVAEYIPGKGTASPDLAALAAAPVAESACSGGPRSRTLAAELAADPAAISAGDAPVIAGFASLSKFRNPETYDATAEVSVYVSRDFRRQGIASSLMAEMISQARACGTLGLLVSFIVVGNEASVKLHERFGFVSAGMLHGIGRKLGHLVDVEIFELSLQDGNMGEEVPLHE